MGLVFVDRECSVCAGEGCDHCQGTGVQGQCVEMPDIRLPEPSPWARSLRKWRRAAGLTWKNLGEMAGIRVARLSELENGLREPTDAEKKVLDACMEGRQ